jgi:hypothetical protein
LRRWTVRWQSSQLEVGEDGNVSGEMKAVSGTIFRDDQPVSDFYADQGVAPQGSEELLLQGNVRIVARKPVSNLRCDRLVWRPQFNRVEAKGNVRMDLPPWQMGVLPEVWADPDLKEAATPDLFRKE